MQFTRKRLFFDLPFRRTFYCFLLTILHILHGPMAFNLNIDDTVVFNIPQKLQNRRNSYFGLAVALYKGDNKNEAALLVGAPRANTSRLESVMEPGSVYKCSPNEMCKEWVIDRSKNGLHGSLPRVNQIRNNSWIGATIAIENKTDPVVMVCAPRWINNVINGNRPNWFMNGICYWTRLNGESFENEADNRVLPLGSIEQQITPSNGIAIFNFGMGQAGFSIHMSSNSLRWDVALGAPGVYNWKGSPILITKSLLGKVETIIPSIRNEKSYLSNDYFGYSITSGCYFKREEYLYASGSPKSEYLYGAVFIHSFSKSPYKKLSIDTKLTGQQRGEYFGASLTSCDLNGDGKDDLIVGAPHWSKDTDEGRVHIFVARQNNNFDRQIINGEYRGGRFGTAVMCLGDIDYDGHGDIAIGAPYEGDGGAVYVFNGNRNGIFKKYSQKVTGSQFSRDIRGFGISISEPRDVNNDRYNDVAVGAYLSEQVVLLKSKPVVTMLVKLTHLEKKKLLSNSTSFFIDVSTSYHGIYVPETIKIVRHLKLDPTYGRAMRSLEKNSDNVYKLPGVLNKTEPLNERVEVHLVKNIQNVINPIEIYVTVHLEDDLQTQDEKLKKNGFCTSCVVVDKIRSKTEDFIELPFVVDCGDDDLCTSDLKISLSTNLKSNDTFVIGSSSTVKLAIDVGNHGEPAYQTQVYIYIPEPLSLASMPPECMENSQANDTLEVICDIGNLFEAMKGLILELDMSEVRFDIKSIELRANVVTQSDEANQLDNNYSLLINFNIDVDIAIAGKAQEDLYSFFHKDESKNFENLRFQHVYEVQKFGASPINEAVLTVIIPTYWMYLTDDVEIVSINQTTAYMDGRQFNCMNSNHTKPKNKDSERNDSIEIHSSNDNETFQRFTEEQDQPINLPPNNRTLYINCTNSAVLCKKIECKLGSFTSSLSVAKLTLTLDIWISKLRLNMLEEKDIVFFVTEGSVRITHPSNIVQVIGHKPDSTVITTTFLGSPIVQRVAIWIIALSILLGIILFVLLVLGLIKVGFFNRKKKEELDELKAEIDRRAGIVLETTSSQEVLDQEQM